MDHKVQFLTMEQILIQLEGFGKRQEQLKRENEELVKGKEELFQLLKELQEKYNNQKAGIKTERENKVKAIQNLKELKKKQEETANLEVNRLQEEMSAMTSTSEYERVLKELHMLKEQNATLSGQIEHLNKVLASRNDIVIRETMAGFKPEDFMCSQLDMDVATTVDSTPTVENPPTIKHSSGAFAPGFNPPEPKSSSASPRALAAAAADQSDVSKPPVSTPKETKLSVSSPSCSTSDNKVSSSTKVPLSNKKQKVSNYCCKCEIEITEMNPADGVNEKNDTNYKLLIQRMICKRCFMKGLIKY